MPQATYEDIQALKAAMAALVSDFRFRFDGVDVEVVLKARLETRHGIETIGVKLQEVPAMRQGVLPLMHAQEDDTVIAEIRALAPTRH